MAVTGSTPRFVVRASRYVDFDPGHAEAARFAHVLGDLGRDLGRLVVLLELLHVETELPGDLQARITRAVVDDDDLELEIRAPDGEHPVHGRAPFLGRGLLEGPRQGRDLLGLLHAEPRGGGLGQP